MTDIRKLSKQIAHKNKLRWLAKVTHQSATADPDNAHKELRAVTCWGFVRIFDICQPKFWLSESDLEHLEHARHMALNAYKALCDESLKAGNNRYPMKPKSHLCDHCLRDCAKTC